MKNKTKNSIKNELINILQTEKLEKVSVTNLCQALDINRSTFYLHFDDIYTVLDQIEDEMIMRIKNLILENIKLDYMTIVLKIISMIKEYKKTYMVLLNQLYSHFIKKLNVTMNPIIINSIENKSNNNLINYYMCSFIITGSIGVISEWLKNDCNPSEQEVISSFFSLLNIKNI